MEIHRPSSPAWLRRSLFAVLAAVALGLLGAQPGAEGLPGNKSKTDTRPLDQGGKGDARTQLVQAAIAYSAATHTSAPVLALAQALARIAAQEAEERFWFDKRRTAVAAGAQVVGARSPVLALTLRLHGVQMLVWDEAVPDHAPPLNAAWLDEVRDEKPFLDLRERTPDELRLPRYRGAYQEYLAYCQAVVLSAQLPAAVFARSATDNPDLNFPALYNEPARHRGKVVHLEGRLKRLSRYDAPLPAQRQGVKWVYEGWIFRDTPGPPVVVIFTDVPPELKLGDAVRPPRVAFDGYFFKKFRYRSGKEDHAGRWQMLTTLLFVGPTVKVQTGPPPRSGAPMASPLSGPVVYGVIGFVGFAVILLVGLNLWYRRSDRTIRSRLVALQGERFLTDGLAEFERNSETPADGPAAASEPDGQVKNGQRPPGEAPAQGNGHEPRDFP